MFILFKCTNINICLEISFSRKFLVTIDSTEAHLYLKLGITKQKLNKNLHSPIYDQIVHALTGTRL
jgi:hypothetical protein